MIGVQVHGSARINTWTYLSVGLGQGRSIAFGDCKMSNCRFGACFIHTRGTAGSRRLWQMDQRAKINSGCIECSRVAARICARDFWRALICMANLETHKLFKFYSITLSPAAVPAWSDPAQHHTQVLIVFCCFTGCRIRSIPCLVKVGHRSSWLCYAAKRFLKGRAGVLECDIWAEEHWWSLTDDSDDSVHGSSFFPNINTCEGGLTDYRCWGKWTRHWDAHLKASKCFYWTLSLSLPLPGPVYHSAACFSYGHSLP